MHHKSRVHRFILDLTFRVKINNKRKPLANNMSVPTALWKVLNCTEMVLLRITHPIAIALASTDYLFATVDVKDSF